MCCPAPIRGICEDEGALECDKPARNFDLLSFAGDCGLSHVVAEMPQDAVRFIVYQTMSDLARYGQRSGRDAYAYESTLGHHSGWRGSRGSRLRSWLSREAQGADSPSSGARCSRAGHGCSYPCEKKQIRIRFVPRCLDPFKPVRLTLLAFPQSEHRGDRVGRRSAAASAASAAGFPGGFAASVQRGH